MKEKHYRTGLVLQKNLVWQLLRNCIKKVTANQYAELIGLRRLNSFLKKVYGKETKTLAEWKKIFQAERYV